MAINPKIKQKAEDIRSKIFGSEVRESLASGIEAISEDVEATIGRQGYVEEQLQDVLDETTGKDVISAPELIAARNGKSNLKTRLDDEHAQVTAQLQQTEQEFNSQLADKATRSELEVEKQRINQLQNIPVGGTTGDAALEDIKIGFDGKTYETPGVSVREQVNLVYDTLAKVSGFDIQTHDLINMVNNGDFAIEGADAGLAEGLTAYEGTNYSLSDGVQTVTPTTSNYLFRKRLSNTGGCKVYISIEGKTNSSWYAGGYGLAGIISNVDGDGTFVKKSAVFDGANEAVSIIFTGPMGNVFNFKNFIVLNLTEIFGLGNEPSKEEMDAYISEKLYGYVSENGSEYIGLEGTVKSNLDLIKNIGKKINFFYEDTTTNYVYENGKVMSIVKLSNDVEVSRIDFTYSEDGKIQSETETFGATIIAKDFIYENDKLITINESISKGEI